MQERDNSGSHRFCAKVQGERDEFVRGFVPEGEREAEWKRESDAEENVKPGYGEMSMTFMIRQHVGETVQLVWPNDLDTAEAFEHPLRVSCGRP